MDEISEVASPRGNRVEQRSLPKGVYRTSWGNRWWAEFRLRGERIYLGTFASPEEAEAAYRAARERVGLD